MKLVFSSDWLGHPPEVFRRTIRGKRSKNWYWRDQTGGRDIWRSTKCASKKDAELIAYEQWRARQTDKAQGLLPEAQTRLATVWAMYEKSEQCELLEPSTRLSKSNRWKMFSDWCGGKGIQYIHHVNEETAKEFLSSGDWKNKYYNNLLGDLKTTIRHAGLKHNPFENIPNRSIRRGEGRSEAYQAFADEEIYRILDAIKKSRLKAKDEWYDACLIALHTGLRYKDIALLTFSSIKIDERGKYLEIIPHKTANRTGGKAVYIRITRQLDEILMRRQSGRMEKLSSYVLPSLAADYQRPPNLQQGTNSLRQCIFAKNNIQGSFHCFRVTVITRAKIAGIDLEDFGGVVGHTTLRQTEAYNRAALEVDMEKIINTKWDISSVSNQ